MRFRYDVGLKIGLKRNSIHDRSYRSLPQAGVNASQGGVSGLRVDYGADA